MLQQIAAGLLLRQGLRLCAVALSCCRAVQARRSTERKMARGTLSGANRGVLRPLLRGVVQNWLRKGVQTVRRRARSVKRAQREARVRAWGRRGSPRSQHKQQHQATRWLADRFGGGVQLQRCGGIRRGPCAPWECGSCGSAACAWGATLPPRGPERTLGLRRCK